MSSGNTAVGLVLKLSNRTQKWKLIVQLTEFINIFGSRSHSKFGAILYQSETRGAQGLDSWTIPANPRRTVRSLMQRHYCSRLMFTKSDSCSVRQWTFWNNYYYRSIIYRVLTKYFASRPTSTTLTIWLKPVAYNQQPGVGELSI
jgi:hypothetical protein